MKRLLKSRIIGLLLVLIGPMAQAQTYSLHWRTETALTGIGLGTGISALLIGRQIKPLSAAQIAVLDRRQVPVLDQKATYWGSEKARRASDLLFYGATAMPLLLLADRNIRGESAKVSVLYFETLLLSGGFTQLTKNLVHRSRPYTYNPDFPLGLKQGKDARRSFFSGHTSSTAASCFFAAKVWSDFHPHSKLKPLVWVTAATFPALTGFFRIRAGRHFLTDVAVGYAVGATIGYLVPYLHRQSTQ